MDSLTIHRDRAGLLTMCARDVTGCAEIVLATGNLRARSSWRLWSAVPAQPQNGTGMSPDCKGLEDAGSGFFGATLSWKIKRLCSGAYGCGLE